MKTSISQKIINLLTAIFIFLPQFIYAASDDYKNVLPSEDDLIELSKTNTNPSNNLPVSLPYGELLTQFLPSIIKILLAVTGSLLLIALVTGGVMMVVSQGKEDQITKAKSIIINAIIGILVISAAYAITLGIAKLSLDTTV